MSVKILKTFAYSEERDRHYRWYMSVPSRVRPEQVYPQGDYNLIYSFIDGQHPIHWSPVWRAASFYLWGDLADAADRVTGEQRINYVNYCCGVEAQLFNRVKLRRAYDVIYESHLTPVKICHGDLTFANCIHTEQGIVFIDPGCARGLPCREIDEAKLMQSLDGFDELYRNHQPPSLATPFPARPVHKALLATHYLRLLRHIKKESCVRLALQRIDQIERNL
jgi:hypothetical protein